MKHGSTPIFLTFHSLLLPRSNLEEIVSCNARDSYTCGINKFSALTPQERKQFLGLKNITDL